MTTKRCALECQGYLLNIKNSSSNTVTLILLLSNDVSEVENDFCATSTGMYRNGYLNYGIQAYIYIYIYT